MKSVYHYLLARLAPIFYGHPSDKMVVIGVTGTNGKSTTVEFVGRMLEHAGFRVGWTGTASFKVGDKEWANDRKMTMLGRFQTQKLLRDMVRAGCTHAVVETSSQGIAQFRHVGINYDVVVFTNLTPEHIEAHGGFENYKQAKGRLFAALSRGRRKGTDKSIVANIDDEHAAYFLSFPADQKYGFGIDARSTVPGLVPVIATNLSMSAAGSSFDVSGTNISISPIGRFNVYNALAAMSVCRALRLSWDAIRDAARSLRSVPGRLEPIDEGQPFSVIVDYAYEPAALAAAYAAIDLVQHERIIHVLGSAGGGRDVARRPVLGHMAAEHDDVVIVTNEDPYDDDPAEIVRQVARGAEGTQGVEVLQILDRQEAIDKAVALARPNDLVLITGKGCEPVMAVGRGKKIPWDDRVAARKALRALGYDKSH
jgi:UDP-N-acetylmuramoyl-L-alanyl-D-glutamate--2,6-diaminopimelate ligase